MVVQSAQPPSQIIRTLKGVLDLALNLDHLHAFLVVTEEGSINRAAARLLRAQTAVGRQIKLLEETMGVALFERTASGVILTEAGNELIEFARRIFQNVAEAEAAMARVGADPSGELVIAVPNALVEQLGPVLFTAITDKYPLITLTMLEGDSHAVHQWITNGMAQIGLLPEGQNDSSLHTIECGRQVLCLCGATKAMSALPETIELKRALSFPLALTMRPNRMRQMIDHAATSIGSEVRPVLSTNSTHLINMLMRQNKVYSIRPYLGDAPAVVNGITYIPLCAPEVSRSINIVWSTAYPVTRTTEAARTLLCELMAGLN